MISDRHTNAVECVKHADLILELTGEMDTASKDQQQQEESYEERLARKQQEFDEYYPAKADDRKEYDEERLARKEGIYDLSDVDIGHSMQILALTGDSEGTGPREISDRMMGLSAEGHQEESYEERLARKQQEYDKYYPPTEDDRKEYDEERLARKEGIYDLSDVGHSMQILALTGDSEGTGFSEISGGMMGFSEEGLTPLNGIGGSASSHGSYNFSSAQLETTATPAPPVATLHKAGSHMRRLTPTMSFSKPDLLKGSGQPSESSGRLSVPGAYIVTGVNASDSERECEINDVIREDDDEETATVAVRETELDRYEETGVRRDDEVETQIQDATVEQAISTSKHIKRRHLYMLVGVLVAVIGVGAGVRVAVSGSGDGDSKDKLSPVNNSTEAPTIPVCSVQAIYSQCQDGESFFLPSDIPDCAAEQYDYVRESLTTEMYSSLLADVEKTSCAPENLALLTLAANEEESTVKYILNVLYFSTNGHEWDVNTGWLSTEPECTWRGIQCSSDGVIVWLELRNNNLSGSLPTMIGHLDTLVDLSLGFNNLISAIPTELGNLEKLEILDLSDNPFDDGPIPTHIFSLSEIRHIFLWSTHRSGTLPIELAVLSQLRTIDLESNDFSGTIPSVLFSLPSLEDLLLSNNYLSGTIPTEMGSLSAIVRIVLGRNKLSGAMPTELGLLTTLKFLDLTMNDLTGTIPNEMGSLSVIVHIDLRHNKLSGAMPTELGLLTTLATLFFCFNNLSGFIPQEVCDLSLDSLVNPDCSSFGRLECPSA
jgi:Leucine-rich repeat (LRR) protein